jgi:enterochelin esterase-like enzyme
MKVTKLKSYLMIKAFIALLFLCNLQITYSQDKNIPSPPSGYDTYKSANPRGKTEIVSYYSSVADTNRKTRVYLPPGYSEDSLYNVLYLLHGIGGDINEWYNLGTPHFILENLYAQGKIAPMIVVLPNGRAMKDDSPGSNIYAADKVEGFAKFEIELINDLIPFIDSIYPVKPGREARAIAGLSMGGGQALNFGLAHLDTFAWVGAFSPAPNTKAANLLFPNLTDDTSKISALWLSVGTADGLLYVAQNTHNYLVQNDIDHYYLLESGKGHDWSVWKPGLYHFVQRIFGVEPVGDTATITPISDILQYNVENELKLKYNPSDQTITILENCNIVALYIYDITGRLKLTQNLSVDKSYNVSELPSGVYIVVVSDGIKNLHKKFTKL